jgi:adenylylsulfate kinase-like enzyme
MSAAFVASVQKALENEKTTLAEIEAAVLNSRREKLLVLYGDALEKALIVADNLQTTAENLQSAIDRLAEVDASMVEYLRY